MAFPQFALAWQKLVPPTIRRDTAILLLCGLAVSPATRADVVEFKNGGRLTGQLESSESSPGNYRLETHDGGVIEFSRSEVARIVNESPTFVAYRRLAQQSPDTAEAHRQIAQWCREQRLLDQYRSHLERVVQLDPEDDEALSQLGFQKHGDRWLSREELMASRGLVLHRGDYRTVQEIALLERNAQADRSEAEWSSNIRRWYRWLGDRNADRRFEAQEKLRNIRDPAAGETIAELLLEARDAELKLFLMDIAAGIQSLATLDAILNIAIRDRDDEIRHLALEHLLRKNQPNLARPFVQALRSNDNRLVNQAASALETIGNQATIGPLIDALITQHRSVTSNGPTGNHSYSMSSNGGFSFGGSTPKVSQRAVKNPAVLTALVAISGGKSFGYDQRAWRQWHDAVLYTGPVQLRRDP